MQRALELLLPELQKLVQLGEFGKQIVGLPEIGLQQPAMIGTPIQDVRRGQAVTLDLLDEIAETIESSICTDRKFPIPALGIASQFGKQTV